MLDSRLTTTIFRKYKKMDFRRRWLPFPTWVWIIIISVNLVWSCSPRSASAAPTVSECGMDSHCQYGQYCHFPTKSCVNCTDCSKFKLKPGISDCAKGKNECGLCQEGFTMDEGDTIHCTANPHTHITPKINFDFERSSNGDPGGISLGLIVAVAVCVPTLAICLAYAGIMYYKKLRTRPQPPSGTELALIPGGSNGSRETGGKQLEWIEVGGLPEEYCRPPPYNETDILAACLVERAIPLSAVPGGLDDLGIFPSQDIRFLQSEDDGNDALFQIVPDSEQANVTHAIVPLESAMQSNVEMSESMVDLSEWFSPGASNNFSGIAGESELALPNQILQQPIQLSGYPTTVFHVDIPPRTSTPVVDMEQGQNSLNDSHEENQIPMSNTENSFALANLHGDSSAVVTPRAGPSRNDSGNFSLHPEEFLLQVDIAAYLAVHGSPAGGQSVQSQPQHQLSLQLHQSQLDLNHMVLDDGIDSFNSDNDEIEASQVNRDVPEPEDLYSMDGEFSMVDEDD